VATVHIIDDDDAVRDALMVLLETEDLPAKGYPSAEAFLAQRPWAPGCLVTDMHLEGLNGLELLRRLPVGPGSPPAIIITGRAGLGLADEARRLGAFAFIEKPFAAATMIAAVRDALALCGAD
jgi:FixJ family two-component response regulator